MTVFENDIGQILTSEDVLFTRQVATFKNFSIKGDVSVSFTVPNNSENRKVLGYYGYNQINSPLFSENEFDMIRNGNKVTRGTIVIEQDDGESLTLFFISGNANWIGLLQFNCREVRNSALNILPNRTEVFASWGQNASGVYVSAPRDYGIVFPVVDWWAKGQRFSNRQFGGRYATQDGENITPFITDFFPCLFLHTLVNEISKVAGIKITGDLIDDKFYKSIIITPESAELVDPDTNQIIPLDGLGLGGALSYIKISMLAPDRKAIDIIKWLSVSFGCIAYFDVAEKALYLNKVNNFKKEDAEDWSEYLKSYIIYNDVYQNNYVRVPQLEDDDYIFTYNENNALKYGEDNIESEKVDGSENEIYTSIFVNARDYISDTPLAWAVPYLPYYVVEDDQELEYTSVTNSGGNAVFNGTGFPFNAASTTTIFRVEDDNGTYTGYHTSLDLASLSSTTLTSSTSFISDSTGKIFTQSVTLGNPGCIALVYLPRINANQFTSQSDFVISNPFTSVATAYYAKQYTPYAFLNGNKRALHYGNIEGIIDTPLSESYMRFFKNPVMKPRLRANMLLPESVFQKFKFDKFVYLNKGDINGYFIVEGIVNYKDSRTLVEVNLYQA